MSICNEMAGSGTSSTTNISVDWENYAQKCMDCKSYSDSFYVCTTCDCANDELSSDQNILCDACVISHLKRNHSITDRKGNKPLICSEHKMLEQEYCRTCDGTFCWKCTVKHSKHEFDTLDKRGSELRKIVFEKLTELELGEKSLRFKKEELSTLSCELTERNLKLRETIEEQIEINRQKFLKLFDKSCSILNNEIKKVTECTDQTVDLQSQLRVLLSSSNDHLLKTFSATLDQVNHCQDLQNQIAEMHNFSVKSLGKDEIVKSFDRASNSICEDLKPFLRISDGFQNFESKDAKSRPIVLKTLIANEFYAHDCRKLYKVSQSCGQLEFEDVMIDKYGKVTHANRKKLEFICSVTNHFWFYCYSIGPTLLLITDSERCFNIIIRDTELLKTEIVYPLPENYLTPYTMSNNSSFIHWCYWDKKDKLIKFTGNPGLRVKCDTLPTIRRSDSTNECATILITADNNVIIASPFYGFCRTIKMGNYGKISSTTAIDQVIILWCCEGQCVFVCDNYGSSPPVRYEWNKKSLFTYIAVDETYKFDLLPGLKNAHGDYDYYLFMVYLR